MIQVNIGKGVFFPPETDHPIFLKKLNIPL